MDRRIPIVIAVVGFHVLGLWALQAGLLRRAVELVVPVAVLSDVVEPPAPQIEPAPQPPAPTPRPSQPRPFSTPEPRRPVAIAPPTPEPQSSAAVVESQTAAPAQAPVSAAESAPPPAPPPPPKIELPSSDAAYLRNPKPPYPPLSRRLGEQGTVVVRALVDASGVPSEAEVRTSSGYERLDQAALQAVLGWRFVPGKRAGVPEAMWINVPMPFRLEK